MKSTIIFGITFLCIWLMYRFPHVMLNPGELTKGHREIKEKCASCHNPFGGISNVKCISCHKLSEIGKDTTSTKEKILFHEKLSSIECTSCHTDHKGLDPEAKLAGFKHDLLESSLINNCNSCHKAPSDNLHRQLSADCKKCHNINGWKNSVTFNHDIIEGADKNICSSCHKPPGDKYHQSFKDNCNKCHNTDRWKPSTFDHSSYFQLDNKHNAECNICHTNNNFSTYTCYGCHEHSESKIRNEHNEEGINNFSDCVSCHRSGNEHDIRMNGKSGNELNQGENRENSEKKKSGKKNNQGEHEKEND